MIDQGLDINPYGIAFNWPSTVVVDDDTVVETPVLLLQEAQDLASFKTLSQRLIDTSLKYYVDCGKYVGVWLSYIARYIDKHFTNKITKTYSNTTWNTNKTFYIKTTFSCNKFSSANPTSGNVVNYDYVT